MQKILNLPKNLVLSIIRFYQNFLSIDQSFWGKHTGVAVCIHEPYCSEYTYQAVEKHGIFKGFVMGFFRILRCNPFSKGGLDPVPDHFSIRKNDVGDRSLPVRT